MGKLNANWNFWMIPALGVAILLMLVITGLLVLRRPAASRPIRHVVFISMDTTRADHFGCYGNQWIKTPNIDALARESILLTDYMTVVPSTLASHTSLFTGNYPHTHGVPSNGYMVNEENGMLPEILKRHGFTTAGFPGSFALDSRFHFDQGFDQYDERYSVSVGDHGADQNQRSAAEVTDAAIAYLKKRDVPSHLFLFVHYFDPHAPYLPPSPYDKMYLDRSAAGHESSDGAVCGGKLIVPEPPERKRWPELYAGEISYMDSQIGRLLSYLKSSGILEDALLVVTSDHGETFRDHKPNFNHGRTVYQSAIHTVGMIRLPGAARGGTNYSGVSANIDILPTTLSLLSIPAPRACDGEAIPLLEAHPQPPEKIRFSEATQPSQGIEIKPRWMNETKSRCVRDGKYKYIQTPFEYSEELYDLNEDPCEQSNLLKSSEFGFRQTADALKAKLGAWTDRARPLKSSFEQKQHEETIRRLKQLGYLGAGDSATTAADQMTSPTMPPESD